MSVLRNRLKRSLAPAILVVLAALATASLLGAGVLQRSASEGADPAAAFTEVPEGAPALAGIVTWAPDGALQQREMEPATRRMLEASWTRAWEALQRAGRGDGSLLEAWFAGPALTQVESSLAIAEGPVDLRIGAHTLQVRFYSDDGTVVGVSADPVRTERVIEVGDVVRRLVTDEAIDVVFMLEDGNWRIRQWLRTDIEVVLPQS